MKWRKEQSVIRHISSHISILFFLCLLFFQASTDLSSAPHHKQSLCRLFGQCMYWHASHMSGETHALQANFPSSNGSRSASKHERGGSLYKSVLLVSNLGHLGCSNQVNLESNGLPEGHQRSVWGAVPPRSPCFGIVISGSQNLEKT